MTRTAILSVPRRSADTDAVCLMLGRALFVGTTFEVRCHTLAAITKFSVGNGFLEVSDEFEAWINTFPVLNKSIKTLSSRRDFPDDLQGVFQTARTSRNWVIHQAAKGVETPGALELLRPEIEKAVRAIASANLIASELIAAEQGMTLPSETDRVAYPEAIVAWACRSVA